MLLCKVEGKIKAELGTDSEPFITSVATLKRVSSIKVFNILDTIKEVILDGRLHEILYIQSKDNITDLFTKYKVETQEFANMFLKGKYKEPLKNIIVLRVRCEHGDEVCLYKEGVEIKDENLNKYPNFLSNTRALI